MCRVLRPDVLSAGTLHHRNHRDEFHSDFAMRVSYEAAPLTVCSTCSASVSHWISRRLRDRRPSDRERGRGLRCQMCAGVHQAQLLNPFFTLTSMMWSTSGVQYSSVTSTINGALWRPHNAKLVRTGACASTDRDVLRAAPRGEKSAHVFHSNVYVAKSQSACRTRSMGGLCRKGERDRALYARTRGHLIPCHTMSGHVVSCHDMPCRIVSSPVMWSHVVSFHVMQCRIVQYLVV